MVGLILLNISTSIIFFKCFGQKGINIIAIVKNPSIRQYCYFNVYICQWREANVPEKYVSVLLRSTILVLPFKIK